MAKPNGPAGIRAYPSITAIEARKLDRNAAIIRRLVGRTIVFGTVSDAFGHETARQSEAA